MKNKTKKEIAIVIVFACVVGVLVWWYGIEAPHAQRALPPAAPITHPFGTVIGIDGHTLTLQSTGSVPLTVLTSPNTTYHTGSTTESFSDIHEGSIVSISDGVENADNVITAYSIEILPKLIPPPQPGS